MNYLIKNANIVNEGDIFISDVFIRNGRIAKIARQISNVKGTFKEIDAEGKYLIPGIIDDQVHFRGFGEWAYKADPHSESLAAVAGGVTSYMDMHNIKPPTVTERLLNKKYSYAARMSLANYSFYMGVANDNYDEVMKIAEKQLTSVCGLKIFMGSSTGNLLVDNEKTLENIFRHSGNMLIATHCEDEATIKANAAKFDEDMLGAADHPHIRNVEACYKSSLKAVALAKKYGTRLHVFHITTEEETELFSNKIPLKDKRITAEVCVHHLWFTSKDYDKYGNLIKCNPAIKEPRHKEGLWKALLEDKLDVVATDHAAHCLWEKRKSYKDAPSGIPLIQHSFTMMYEQKNRGRIPLEEIVQKMCHNPAVVYNIVERGFIREGYYADLFLFDPSPVWTVCNSNLSDEKGNVLTKGGWSPFHGESFRGKVTHTFVNGHLAYNEGIFDESAAGMRLEFDRH